MSIKLSMTIPQAAESTGFTEKQIRMAIHAGALKAKRATKNKDGEGVGKYILRVGDLETWLDGLADA